VAVCAAAGPDRFTWRPTIVHYEFDAIRNADLLKREGQIDALRTILQELKNKDKPLPQTLYLSLILPEAYWLDRVERGLDTMNRLAHPTCWTDQLKHAVFQRVSGVDATLQPVRYARDPQAPEQKIHVTVDLTGVSHEDVDRLDRFLRKRTQAAQ
jgi:hypothetical protein